MRSRYYNPEWCRFVNADSLIDTVSGQNGSNIFAYCLNNPVNGCDPCGTCYHKAPYSSTYNFTCSTCASYGGNMGAWNSGYISSTTSKTSSATKSSTSASKTPVVLQKVKPNMTPRKDSKKGSDTRGNKDGRERNIGIDDEHSRVPKGSGLNIPSLNPRKIQNIALLAGMTIAIAFVVGNDAFGMLYDDVYLENLTQIWWDTASKVIA